MSDPKELLARAERLSQTRLGDDPDIADARREYDDSTPGLAGEGEVVARVEDRELPGPGGALRARVYSPASEDPPPAVLYLHGGGWVVGSIVGVDAACRALANRAGVVVVSLEYRLAPEHPYPAALEDAEAALAWLAEHAGELGGDAARLAVAGDSAGANVATVLARRTRDSGGPPIAFQLLVYPATDAAMDTRSYEQFGSGFGLDRDAMAGSWDAYRGDVPAEDPGISPLRAADLAGLPPGLVITAENDPLRDEGEAYAQRLREAGVETQSVRLAGMVHGFFRWRAICPEAEDATRAAAAALRAALSL